MLTKQTKILIADDESAIRKSLTEILRFKGFDCTSARDGKEAVEIIKNEQIDLVLLDLELPRMKGVEVLKRALEMRPEMQIIIISAYGTIQKAMEITRLGAYDFIEKPLEAERILLTIRRALEQRRLKIERDRLLEESRSRYKMIGGDGKMEDVFVRIDRAAAVDSTVLVTGANGTGKELAARAIHLNSKRAAFPFVPVNCAAIPETLIESEFFGYAKGAFTGATADRKGKFQQAQGGTLFLDEIGEMSLRMQAKLLHAVDAKTIDPIGGKGPVKIDLRLIAATNRDLKQEVEAGNFREDLYFRINVIPVSLPPLCERKNDVQPLAAFFLDEVCKTQGLSAKVFSQDVWAVLMNYHWPGNVRELRHAIERAAVLGSDKTIGAAQIKAALQDTAEVEEKSNMGTLRQARAAFERDYIIQALTDNNGKIQKTAKALGVQRGHLWKKMKQYDIRN